MLYSRTKKQTATDRVKHSGMRKNSLPTLPSISGECKYRSPSSSPRSQNRSEHSECGTPRLYSQISPSNAVQQHHNNNNRGRASPMKGHSHSRSSTPRMHTPRSRGASPRPDIVAPQPHRRLHPLTVPKPSRSVSDPNLASLALSSSGNSSKQLSSPNYASPNYPSGPHTYDFKHANIPQHPHRRVMSQSQPIDRVALSRARSEAESERLAHSQPIEVSNLKKEVNALRYSNTGRRKSTCSSTSSSSYSQKESTSTSVPVLQSLRRLCGETQHPSRHATNSPTPSPMDSPLLSTVEEFGYSPRREGSSAPPMKLCGETPHSARSTTSTTRRKTATPSPRPYHSTSSSVSSVSNLASPPTATRRVSSRHGIPQAHSQSSRRNSVSLVSPCQTPSPSVLSPAFVSIQSQEYQGEQPAQRRDAYDSDDEITDSEWAQILQVCRTSK